MKKLIPSSPLLAMAMLLLAVGCYTVPKWYLDHQDEEPAATIVAAKAVFGY
jgi:hypothetical protein